VELACNCYGCHVLQKALDCEEEVRLLIVSELLLGDPAQTLVNKHASHVWSKVLEIGCRKFEGVNEPHRSWSFRGRPPPPQSSHSAFLIVPDEGRLTSI
jgi:hypothetical protein